MDIRVAGRFGPQAFCLPAGMSAASAQGGWISTGGALPAATAATLAPHDIDAAVDALNGALKPLDTRLQFAIDRDTRKVVVKLVDMETGDVIRQYPSEELLALAKAVGRKHGGLLKEVA